MKSGSVAAFVDRVKMRANRNSSHAERNASMPVATSPGAESGSNTRKSACTLVHPSILAASSSSAGIVRKKPHMNEAVKPRFSFR